jgi:hypothetical protein
MQKDRLRAVSFCCWGNRPVLAGLIALAALVARERAALMVSTVNQALSCWGLVISTSSSALAANGPT